MQNRQCPAQQNRDATTLKLCLEAKTWFQVENILKDGGQSDWNIGSALKVATDGVNILMLTSHESMTVCEDEECVEGSISPATVCYGMLLGLQLKWLRSMEQSHIRHIGKVQYRCSYFKGQYTIDQYIWNYSVLSLVSWVLWGQLFSAEWEHENEAKCPYPWGCKHLSLNLAVSMLSSDYM